MQQTTNCSVLYRLMSVAVRSNGMERYGRGYGMHLQVTHSVPRPGATLQAMQATLINSSRLERIEWEDHASDLARRIEVTLQKGAQRAAEQQEAESVQPEL